MTAKCLMANYFTSTVQNAVDGNVAIAYIYLKHQHALVISHNFSIIQQ